MRKFKIISATVVFISIIFVTTVFVSCFKSNEIQKKEELSAKESRQVVNPSWSGGGVTCNCAAGESVCGSNCSLSACCLCWNPVDYQGACGCYFGISTCKTEKLKSDIKIKYPNEILIFSSNIEQTIEYISNLGINTNDINNKYIALKNNCNYRSTGVYVVNDYEQYYQYANDWNEFCKSQPYTTQVQIMQYIKMQFPIAD